MAHVRMGWRPQWNLEKALLSIIEWNNVLSTGGDVRNCCTEQIYSYESVVWSQKG